MYKILLFLCIFKKCGSINLVSSENVNEELLVLTSNGYVQGIEKVTHNGKAYKAYQGIPYAKPPLGNLRFKAPEQAFSWSGVLNGSEEGNGCVELMNLPNNSILMTGDEDCLNLNVYVPKNTHHSLPVLVWIYGGIFLFGNSSSLFYGADNILDQNIIVVTFNYRIGVFGFLSTEDLESPGNYGLKDQNLALQWVQANIRQFGGNPNSVTIYGQSAGGASVFYHMASPISRGLFQGVISSSGSPLCYWSVKRKPATVAFDIGLATGIRTNNTKELVSKLRKLSTDKFKKASKLLLILSVPQSNRDGFPFAPTIEPYHEGAFITKSAYNSLKRGEFYKVPVLMGTNSLEGLFFSNVIELLKPLTFIFDLSPGSLPNGGMNIKAPDRHQVGLEILERYFPNGIGAASDNEFIEYITDDFFTRPLHKTVQLISKYTPLYFYVFSYTSEYGKGSIADLTSLKPLQGTAHVEDLFYIWRRKIIPDPQGMDKIVSERFMRLWSNFIKYRNPTPRKEKILQEKIWPSVTSTKNVTYLRIDRDISIHQNYKEEIIAFWENIYKKYVQPPLITY